MSVRVLSRKSAGRAPAARAAPKTSSGSLLIGDPEDAFEHEADRGADQLMAGAAPQFSWAGAAGPPGGGSRLQRKCACGGAEPCEKCKKKEESDHQTLQRKASGPTHGGHAPQVVHDVLRSPGQRLNRGDRAFFESRLGHDFGHIQVHTGAHAAEAAHAVGALAYTVGEHIVFGRGQYQPNTPGGLRLLSHEIVHTLQQADGRASRSVVQRGTTPGWTGSASGSLNAGENVIGKIRRIPIEDLKQGNQNPNAATGRESAQGRAIVLLHKDFVATDPADVFLFFHGHNEGFRSGSLGYRDRDVDELEDQMEAAGKKQVIGILPQGTRDSAFGGLPPNTTPTSCNGFNLNKAFNTDAYITEVLDKLTALKVWSAKPAIGSVAITGHSGAGELINQGLLGGGAGSSLPQSVGTLREVALYDAINGPCEFVGLLDWLERTLNKELSDLKAKKSDVERRAYLTTSMRFRSYFETSAAIGDYYSKWNVGPLPKTPKFLAGKKPVKDFLADWFTANTTGLDPQVVASWKANYVVIDKGSSVAHDDKKPNIMQAPDSQKVRPIEESVKLLPKRESGVTPVSSAEAPASVHAALESPSRSLSGEERRWAGGHFGHDFGSVRVHAGDRAAESARAIRSLAYTVGNQIVVDPARYRAGTPAGQRLLAHELTHVIQHGDAAVRAVREKNLIVGPENDPLEHEADRRSTEPGPVSGQTPAGLVQRVPAEGQLAKSVCETTQNPPPEQVGECNYARPENCPTYESWIETFLNLKTFAARATPSPGTLTSATPHTFDVIGDTSATRFSDPIKEKEMAKDPNAAPVPTTGLKLGETFIDHPTDTWVKSCLPDNLRATAYQLPADCADIAIVLRHVWLSAHHRTQIIQVGTQTWTIGDASGGPGTANALKAISDIGSQTVTALVAPYSDAQGNPLVAFRDLAPLLHPGDILVWEHRDNGLDKGRTGGHTHTITDVTRDDTGRITSMSFLQGNEPIFGEECEPAEKDSSGLCPDDDKGKIIQQMKLKDTKANRDQLGHAPGRRIEAASTGGPRPNGVSVKDADVELPPRKKGAAPTRVWAWGATTILLAAGPPRAAVRPPMAKPAKGATAERHITDWTRSFAAAASYADWQAVWESMLLEARAFVEGGRDIPEAEARQVGNAAGNKLWSLAKQPKGTLGDESHFRRLLEARAVIYALGDSRKPLLPVSPDLSAPWDQITTKLLRTLSWIDNSFELAARGASDISFAPGKSTLRFLLTGFDPFDSSGSLKAPPRGTWNPSGAAVLALDNQTLPVKSSAGAAATASMQGVVLPVDYDKFQAGGQGLVESIVAGKASDLDAAITVSMDPNLGPAAPVRLERYVVGTHLVPRTDKFAQTRQVLEPIPAAGGGAGESIVESNAPLAQIAADTEKTSKDSGKAIPKPDIGETITLRFGNESTAKKAAAALRGAAFPGTSDVQVSDEKAIHEIINTMQRQTNGIDVTFTAGGAAFTATVVEGPGGNFLSNEVSYRTLRLLGQKKLPQGPLSFHVHTQGANVIPQDTSTPVAKKTRESALAAAAGLLGRLVETLKRIIAATSKAILDRRSKKP
jgi:hypothetical protein